MPKGDDPSRSFLKAAYQDEGHEGMEGSPEKALFCRRKVRDAERHRSLRVRRHWPKLATAKIEGAANQTSVLSWRRLETFYNQLYPLPRALVLPRGA
jgi:hypothetical protein